ncbi:MAG: hypothetical protein GKC53_06170 [Neisseriaceae bacterium]|nr:MAG: hypothetical protein GKC53_06170 [Neisseriaceae bacterium]
MKKSLLLSTIIVLSTFNSIAEPINEAEFSETLKSQQQAIAQNCKMELTKSNSKVDAATKKIIDSYCTCVAENTSLNKTYVKKMFNIAKNARSEQEYIKNIEAVGSEISQFCEKKILKTN